MEPSKVATAIKEIEVYGYTVLPNLLSQKTVTSLLSLLEEVSDEEKSRHRQLHDSRKKDKYVYNLQNKNIAFVNLLSNQTVTSIVGNFLNDPYYQVMDKHHNNYILNYYNARSSGAALDLHIDCKFPSTGPYVWVMQVAYVLENMNEDNGCTVVVPGSHKSGEYTDRTLKKRESVTANAGDVILWDSRLWHGTTENLNGKSRWVAIATFSQWWIKQNLDIPRMLPETIYKECSDDEKVLLGFCSIPPVTDEFSVIMKKSKKDLKEKVSDYFLSDRES